MFVRNVSVGLDIVNKLETNVLSLMKRTLSVFGFIVKDANVKRRSSYVICSANL